MEINPFPRPQSEKREKIMENCFPRPLLVLPELAAVRDGLEMAGYYGLGAVITVQLIVSSKPTQSIIKRQIDRPTPTTVAAHHSGPGLGHIYRADLVTARLKNSWMLAFQPLFAT